MGWSVMAWASDVKAGDEVIIGGRWLFIREIVKRPSGSLAFTFMRSGRTEMDGTLGNTYLSREEAEQAALSTAKTFIDQCKLDKDPFLP